MFCLNPTSTASAGEQQCRKCKPCLERRRRHWLGRIAAEAYTSTWMRFVTLTYDDEHLESGLGLPLEHLKDYNKVRRKKYTYKQFAVGELGEKTQRPHWHVLQFGKSLVPETPLDFSARYYGWAKGNSQYEKPRSISGSAAYIYDYMDKGGKAVRPSPGLGKRYLLNWARFMARSGKLLTDQYGIPYTVPNARKPKGGLWQYTMPSGHPYSVEMADVYIEEWVASTHSIPLNYDQFSRISYNGEIEEKENTRLSYPKRESKPPF